MQISDIVEFWSKLEQDQSTGHWFHPADRNALSSQHTFNLQYPVSPYVGQIETAEVIILGAIAGYSSELTPTEFPNQASIEAYVQRVRNPKGSDWSFVSRYYHGVNYGPLVVNGDAALINASPYRSPKVSEEPDNRRVIANLPSSAFNRRWLIEAVLPLAQKGDRLIVAKRAGLWKLPATVKASSGLAVDPAPVSPQITSTAWAAVQEFLKK